MQKTVLALPIVTPLSSKLLSSFLLSIGLMLSSAGCGFFSNAEAEAQSQPREGERRGGAAPVDVAIAKTEALRDDPEYIGTTGPVRQVSVRSQVEGQLLSLNADVGDSVTQGQTLARLNDELLATDVLEAQAELAARRAEVARAQAQVSAARTQVEQARLEYQQAQADAARQQALAEAGAVSVQTAELAQTEARTAAQILRSAQEQVSTQQQEVVAAQGRVAAQQAVITQAQDRRSYAILPSPITGVVLERVTEPGNLIQPGGEILKLGDFSQVKLTVQISELELANIRVGQSTVVRLDAFPDQEFTAEVTRISPAADPTARLLPVEVAIPNPDGRVGSGLLARVSFAQARQENVVVPQSALQAEGDEGAQGEQEKNSTLFVVTGEGEQAKVTARQVVVGDRADGQVEIISGLEPGERFVARSGRPLKEGDSVRISVISETTESESQPRTDETRRESSSSGNT